MIPPLIAQMLKGFINNKIKEYGHMTSLHIDPAARQISLTASLVGETAPIDARVKYTVEEKDGKTWLIPLELECSREWITLLSKQLLKDGTVRFEIPAGIAATAIKMLKI